MPLLARALSQLGPAAHASFLDETFLADRKTTVRQYLEEHPEVMQKEIADPTLRERYSG